MRCSNLGKVNTLGENFQKQILNIPQRTAEEGGRIRRRRKNKEEEEDGVPASKGIPIT